ncbi:hypothetical protein MNBD_ALPHA09-730 [hydrothermal vent metagenome]|uniref:Cytochrome c oxidase subunit CcoQ n=1 Tax=hydrothermal vent metagenome TaxID=652676 RepID=A0A3B0TCX3_9ZZZZ
MDYETLAKFADFWGMLFLFTAFIGVVAFVFRPRARSTYEDCGNIPFKDD